MAYVQNGPQDQQDDQENQQQGAAGAPVSISGSSGSGGAQQGPTQLGPPGGAPSQPKATSSGRFQNIQNYLNANKGYGGSQGFSGQVGQNLQNQAQDIQQDINTQQQDLSKNYQQQASNYDPSKIQDFAKQAFTDPAKYAADAALKQQWDQYYKGSYQDPGQFDPNAQLQQKTQQFQQTAQLAGTESGRGALLNKIYGSAGGYNPGQQTLDQMLLQTQPGSLQQLQNTANQASQGLSSQYQQALDTTNQAHSSLDTAAKSGATTLQDLLSKNIGSEKENLQNKASDLQSQRDAQYAAAQAQLRQGTISPELAKAMGINSNNILTFAPETAGQMGLSSNRAVDITGLDPTQFLTKASQPVGVNNVATSSDQAKFKALAQLMGQPENSELSNFATPSQQSLDNPYNFNSAAFTNALNQPDVGKNAQALKKYLQILGDGQATIGTPKQQGSSSGRPQDDLSV